jgi:hypothetical protein
VPQNNKLLQLANDTHAQIDGLGDGATEAENHQGEGEEVEQLGHLDYLQLGGATAVSSETGRAAAEQRSCRESISGTAPGSWPFRGRAPRIGHWTTVSAQHTRCSRGGVRAGSGREARAPAVNNLTVAACRALIPAPPPRGPLGGARSNHAGPARTRPLTLLVGAWA